MIIFWWIFASIVYLLIAVVATRIIYLLDKKSQQEKAERNGYTARGDKNLAGWLGFFWGPLVPILLAAAIIIGLVWGGMQGYHRLCFGEWID